MPQKGFRKVHKCRKCGKIVTKISSYKWRIEQVCPECYDKGGLDIFSIKEKNIFSDIHEGMIREKNPVTAFWHKMTEIDLRDIEQK